MHTRFLFASVALAALLSFPTPARSAVMVLGGGLGQACWEAAEHGAKDAATLRLCSDALEQEPLNPRDRASTFVNRGVIALRRGALEAATADFDRALQIRPGFGEAFANRGVTRVAQHRYDEALADLDRSLELGVREPEKCWFNKGLAHEGLGDLKAAYADYRRAAELKPGWDLPAQELRRFSVRHGA